MHCSATLVPAMLLTLSCLLPAQVSSYTPFGPGCPGNGGIPFLGTAQGTMPRLGEDLTLRLSNVPDGDGHYIAFGFSTTDWFGIPLPLDMNPFGLFGCTLYISAEFAANTTTAVGGVADVTFTLPNLGNLLGVTFYNQGFVLDPGVNPFAGGAVLSNAASAVIGPALVPPVFDLTGTWEVTETWGENECFPDAPTSVYPVTTTQNGNVLEAVFPTRTSLWTVSGTDVGWAGSFAAQGGMTTMTSSSLVATDANTIQGTIDWCWTQDGSSFCYGTNTLTAVRQ